MTAKPVKAAVYLQDYHSGEGEEQLNRTAESLVGYITHEKSWEWVGTFMDCDRSDPSYQLGRLVKEAEKESIDIIVAGSLSRFNESLKHAMATVDTLIAMDRRILFFEESIDSGTKEGNLLLDQLRSTLAIENKILSVSRKWTFDTMFEKGEPVFARLLGYKKAGREWVVIPEEAEIVKEAFGLYVEGVSPLKIARRFIVKRYQKANGRRDWTPEAIKSILRNEKYTGDVLCRKNMAGSEAAGVAIRKEQYLIRDHHEAIVSHGVFEQASQLLQQGSKGDDRRDIKQYPLSRKLACGLCGANFQRHQSRDKVLWRCGTHGKSRSLCAMTSLHEGLVHQALLKAFFDKFQDSLADVRSLIDFLKGAETYKAEQVTPLLGHIDDLIREENQCVLLGDLGRMAALKDEKKRVEILLSEHTKTLAQMEKDHGTRIKAMGLLHELIDRKGRLPDLRAALEDLWMLRAFFVKVTVQPGYVFDIQWIDAAHSVVEMEAGE